MISFGFMMSLAGLTSLGLKFLDIVLLGKYVALSLVGVYAIAAFIPTLIEAPYNALDRIIAPRVANAWANQNMEEIRDIYKKSTKYMLLAGGLLFIGINLNISTLMNLLPPGYNAGIPVVLIISLGTLLNMATGSNDSIIYNSSKYRYGTYLLIFLFLFAFAVNIVFIPIYGIIGAALATAASALLYNSIKYVIIYRLFNMQPFDGSTLRIIFVIVVTGTLSLFIPEAGSPYLSIAVKSVLITMLYLSLTYAMKIVPEFHHHLFFWKKKG
jgi:O-antigen/teichoic acid export membrane protein